MDGAREGGVREVGRAGAGGDAADVEVEFPRGKDLVRQVGADVGDLEADRRRVCGEVRAQDGLVVAGGLDPELRVAVRVGRYCHGVLLPGHGHVDPAGALRDDLAGCGSECRNRRGVVAEPQVARSHDVVVGHSNLVCAAPVVMQVRPDAVVRAVVVGGIHDDDVRARGRRGIRSTAAARRQPSHQETGTCHNDQPTHGPNHGAAG